MEREERARAHSLAMACPRDAKLGDLYRRVYEFGEDSCYFEGGHLSDILPIVPRACLPLRPYRTEEDLVRATGFTARQLADRHQEGLIEVTIQSYLRFEGLDFYDPLLSLRPKSHIVRGNLALALFINDDTDYLIGEDPSIDCSPKIDEFYAKALEHPVIRCSWEQEYERCREPYQRSTYGSSSPKALIDSFAWKLTYAKVILGDSAVDDLVRAMPNSDLLSVLTSFHIDFEHPFSHGAGHVRAMCGSDVFERHELDVGPDWLQDIRLRYRGFERVPDPTQIALPAAGGTDIDFVFRVRDLTSVSHLWPIIRSAANDRKYPWDQIRNVQEAVSDEVRQLSASGALKGQVSAKLKSIAALGSVGSIASYCGLGPQVTGFLGAVAGATALVEQVWGAIDSAR